MDYGRLSDPLPLPGTADFHKARARYRKRKRQSAQITLEGLKQAFADITKQQDCSYLTDRAHDELVRTIRNIRKGRYRPGKGRNQQIPKSSGGYRTLEIPPIIDRCVSRACLISVREELERKFDSRSHGGRKNLGIDTTLASACKAIESGMLHLVCADVEKAFDYVPVEKALSCLGELLPGHPNLELINCCVRGHLGASKKVGIRQGDNLSPAIFNAGMHFWVDQQIENCSEFAYLRYLDNLYIFSAHAGNGERILVPVQQMLRNQGINLRIDKEVVLNNSQKVGILGFQLGMNDGKIEITGNEKSWVQLALRLVRAFERHNPQQAGLKVIKGWIASQCLRSSWQTEDTLRLNDLIVKYGMDFRISHEEILNLWRPIRPRWGNRE